MTEEFVPYPRPNTDLHELWVKEISNGTFFKAVSNSIANNQQPLNRYINLDDNVLDRLAKGERSIYDVDNNNEVLDIPKIREWAISPHYIEIEDGDYDVIYNPRKYYQDTRWRGREDYTLDDSFEYTDGGVYDHSIYSSYIFFYRPKTKSTDDDYLWRYGILNLYLMSINYSDQTTPYSATIHSCKGYSFRLIGGNKIEIIHSIYPLVTNIIELDSLTTAYAYEDYIFVDTAGEMIVLDKFGVTKITIPNSSPPRFYFRGKYYFLDNSTNGTLVLDTKRWKIKVYKDSRFSEFGVLGLYDFYKGGAYKGTRYNYNLKRYGTWLNDIPKRDRLFAFDQYGDFQHTQDGEIIHTYNFSHFASEGIGFTLSCKVCRFLNINNGSVVGYFGKICLNSSTLSTELFELII